MTKFVLFPLGAALTFSTLLSVLFTALGFILTAIGGSSSVTFIGLAARAVVYFGHIAEL